MPPAPGKVSGDHRPPFGQPPHVVPTNHPTSRSKVLGGAGLDQLLYHEG